jgi:hypothetical protein
MTAATAYEIGKVINEHSAEFEEDFEAAYQKAKDSAIKGY